MTKREIMQAARLWLIHRQLKEIKAERDPKNKQSKAIAARCSDAASSVSDAFWLIAGRAPESVGGKDFLLEKPAAWVRKHKPCSHTKR